jgi:calcium-independent phospholipase A2-gamma
MFHIPLQIIARVSIDNRTRALVQALRRTADPKLCITRVEELTFHLLEFPEGKGVAIKVISNLFNICLEKKFK